MNILLEAYCINQSAMCISQLVAGHFIAGCNNNNINIKDIFVVTPYIVTGYMFADFNINNVCVIVYIYAFVRHKYLLPCMHVY